MHCAKCKVHMSGQMRSNLRVAEQSHLFVVNFITAMYM